MPKSVDLSEFAAVRDPKQNRCWFSRLTSEQQEKVLAAHSESFSAATISKVVRSWEIHSSGTTAVHKHFRGECSCSRA